MTTTLNAAARLTSAVALKAAKDKDAQQISDMIDNEDEAGILKIVDTAPDAKLKKLIIAGYLVPSQWAYFTTKPYPAKLTKLLIASSANESFTDLLNTYYNRDRKLDPESVKLLKADILTNPKKALTNIGLDLDEMMTNGSILDLAKDDKAFFKKLVLKLSPQDHADLLKSEDSEDWKKAFKLVGVEVKADDEDDGDDD